ncbi:MAG TPA: transcriptional regulator [Bacteroidetes bacterium]|nr:transcriptional regulator [Bacteroidota bacterium]
MQLEEAKERFISSWGTLGSAWGINRTMAQIHSLLLVSNTPLSAEEIMAQLQISRGNANMNLRALIDWGLVYREHKSGERKEFFVAEKDIWEVARRVMVERKRREIEPIIRVLEEVGKIDADPSREDVIEFKEMIRKINEFVSKIDGLTDKLSRADRNWFARSIMKLLG